MKIFLRIIFYLALFMLAFCLVATIGSVYYNKQSIGTIIYGIGFISWTTVAILSGKTIKLLKEN